MARNKIHFPGPVYPMSERVLRIPSRAWAIVGLLFCAPLQIIAALSLLGSVYASIYACFWTNSLSDAGVYLSALVVSATLTVILATCNCFLIACLKHRSYARVMLLSAVAKNQARFIGFMLSMLSTGPSVGAFLMALIITPFNVSLLLGIAAMAAATVLLIRESDVHSHDTTSWAY